MGAFGLFSIGRSLFGNKKASKDKKGRGARGKDDPYYENVLIRNRKGELVEKRMERQIPEFLNKHDAKILKKARKLAHRYDMGFGSIGPWSLGWETLIGFLIPAIGDVIGIFFALHVYYKCTKVEGGLPLKTKSRMKVNIALDFMIGLVPFLGDIADGFFRANTTNVMLLEDHLRNVYGPKGPQNKQARWSAGLKMQEDDPDYMHDLRNADMQQSSHVWGEYEKEHNGDHPPVYSEQHRQRQATQSNKVQAPRQYDGQHYDARPQHTTQQPVGRTGEPRQQNTKPQSDWSRMFGYGKKERQADPEVGGGRTDDRWAARA